MSKLIKAIATGEYPAKCFQCGREAEKDHRRFLRTLANKGVVLLVDEAGDPLDLESVRNGTVHFDMWFVSEHDAQVIEEAIGKEAVRLGAEKQRKVQEELERAEEKRKQKLQHAEEQRKRTAELVAAGQWFHPKYRTLREAYADGWHTRKEDEIGGDEITLKGYTLVRNTTFVRYVYKSTLKKTYGLTPAMIEELGEPDKLCDNPHWKSGPPANLYLVERVENWVEANQERVEKARANRPKRSAAMTAANAKKKAERWKKARRWLSGLSISITRPLPKTLLDDARKSCTIPDNVDLLNAKALHAHVRHHHTNYEALLQVMNRHELCNDLYPVLRKLIDPIVKEALVEWLAQLKATAIKQFAQRWQYAAEITKIDNAELPAGSPMYFYCRHCGVPTEVLPEDYQFPPTTVCSQCKGLKSEGWLEEAVRLASNEDEIGVAELVAQDGQHRHRGRKRGGQ